MKSIARLLAPLSLVAFGAAIACTAVVAEDPVQCTSNAECASRGADFVGTVCGAGGLCVPGTAAPTAGECTKNSDCADRGPNQVCSSLQHTCISVVNEDCFVAYGDPTADGTVLYGLMGEVGIDDTLRFREQQHVQGASLAFSDFFDDNRAGARLPGGRKAALVACSEHFPRRASAHLANIGVHAVIGPSLEARQRPMVETLLQARVPSFSPWVYGNPSAVVPDSTGFAWLTGFDRTNVVAPLNALLAEQSAKLIAESGGKVSTIRVAVLVNKMAYSVFNIYEPFGTLMDQRLVFNGKSAIENGRDEGCGNCYRRFATGFANEATVAERAADLLAFKPHFIIPFADVDFGSQLLPALEKQLTTAPADVPRPVYIHPFLQLEDAGYKLLPVGSASMRKRITGIRPLRDNSFEVYQTKFRETFRPLGAPQELGPEPNPGSGRAYETALLLLFATYEALVQKADALPEDVISAIPAVTDSSARTKVTLTDISRGVESLNKREHIDLDGLFTFFDFDPSSTSANVTWTTWCVGDKGQYVSGTRFFKDGSFGDPAFCQ